MVELVGKRNQHALEKFEIKQIFGIVVEFISL